jgi:tRNA1Val (adenine37-N6)-methyltransferase
MKMDNVVSVFYKNELQVRMSIFRFKKFEVVNKRSAMKVNTDGVLLGALMTILPDDRMLLDIGTGTGTIALMAAQRLTGPGFIHAIDIDEPSATEAAMNFRNSPWGGILQAHHASLDDFEAVLRNESESSEQMFDLIFSNPPYFDNALQAPEERRNAARHTSTGLSYREVLDFASRRLTENGRVAMVLPAAVELDLTRHARMNGLHLHKIARIRTVPRKAPKLIVAEFSRCRADVLQDSILTIQNEGQYTQEYLSLTHDFYLFA